MVSVRFLACLTFGTATMAAEQSPLSLLEAIHLAEQQAPDIQARAAALDSAEASIGPAGQLPDPELIIGVDNLPVTSNEAFSLTSDFMTMRKVGVMQQFPRREKRHLRTERAEAAAAQERALLTNERLKVREAVARAWITIATTERRRQLMQTLRPRAEAQLAAATAALTAGRGSAADGIEARAALIALDDRLQALAQDVEGARVELARWLPEAADRPLGELPDWFDLGADPDTLLTNIAHHRELLAYDAAERAADLDVALARADKRPDWSVELAYAQREPHYSNMVSLQFRIGLPLFSAQRQDPLVLAKQASATQIQAEREAARRMHTAELRKTVLTWRNTAERVRRYERELLPLAEDRVAVALAAYQGGRGDLRSSLIALDEAIEQRLTYTELQNTLGQAWATLHFAFPQEP